MPELELLLGVELLELGLEAEPLVEPEAPLLGWSVEDEDALPLGDELGAALDEDEAPPLGDVLGEAEELELEPALGVLGDEELLELELGGVLGVVTVPEAEPLAEPGLLVVEDPEDEVEPDDGGVADPLVLLDELSGPRSQP